MSVAEKAFTTTTKSRRDDMSVAEKVFTTTTKSRRDDMSVASSRTSIHNNDKIP
ncbi:MAG: hypothetical protein LBS55_01830 [Prevotellaceae bacterium]|nr:hypothetical protein [Prevotellaceae bacterium]